MGERVEDREGVGGLEKKYGRIVILIIAGACFKMYRGMLFQTLSRVLIW